ncbi:MAG TPA: tRNA (adenosine(37)-N6)-threonylcarbamoyltransferase complex dimerization subunit type 1 TsaB [Steroidobacteraceae bacterium]|nr:tRNA (adenosine(37)-N6)-threonylcarbamoyltransferase complex dimerization subunit type 1 TsaB [Steroidobacteraceae bacterium]
MRVLALDTATEACSVALLTDDGLLGRCAEVGRAHAEQILGMVDAVLAEAGISLAKLDGIAASIGPGAFTGVRISVAVAQGLCFGANLPVVPVTTLEALALQAMQDGTSHALACLDARMGEVYWGCFASDTARILVACGAPRVGPAAQVKLAYAGARGIGRGFAAYPELAALAGLEDVQAHALPDAREMARIGRNRLLAGAGMDPADLKPQYLRDKVALTGEERAALERAPR